MSIKIFFSTAPKVCKHRLPDIYYLKNALLGYPSRILQRFDVKIKNNVKMSLVEHRQRWF